MGRPHSHPARDAWLAVIALAAFVWLAIAVARGDTLAFDNAIREAIHARALAPLTSVMQAATQLGGFLFLCPLGVVVACALERGARRREAVLFVVAVAGALLVDEAMKLFFHRSRPESFFGYPVPVTYSFPSGHSFVSFCFYLLLAEILADPDWGLGRKLALWSGAAALILLIGFSRVYLGVHYPTDVIGGYTAAIAWAAIVRAAHHRWWS